MFTEFLAEDQIQDEIQTQMVTPVEETRVITSEAEVTSYMEGLSEASGGGTFLSSGQTQQSGTGLALTYSGDGSGNFLLMPDPTSTVHTTSDGTAFSSQRGTADTWTTATTTARGASRMVGRTTVPFYKLIVGKQLTSRQFRGYQDKLARLIHQIVSQDRRQAFIQVGRSAPLPFVTAEIEEPSWTHAGRHIARRFAYKKNNSGLPVAAIEQQKAERMTRIAGIVQEYRREQLPAALTVEAEFEVLEDEPKAKPKPKRVKVSSARTKTSKYD